MAGSVVRSRARLFLLFVAAAAAWGARAPALALPFLPEPTYSIRTVFRSASGDVAGETPAVLALPTPVDVNGDLAPDVLVQLTIDAGRAHLRTLTLPSAPSPLPLLVEAVLADPRGESDLRVGFGFDARDSSAPRDLEGSLGLITDAQRIGSFTLDVATVAPGDQIGIIASLFDERTGTRVDPISLRADLSPVPAAIHAGLLLGSDLGITTSRLDLVTDRPTTVDVLARDVQGSDENRLTLTIDRLPNSVSVSMTEAPTGRRSFDHVGSDRIGVVDARLASLRHGAVLDEAALRFEDMPRRVSFTQDTDEQGVLEASGPIGALQGAFARGGPHVLLDEPAYVSVYENAGHSSVALQLLGLVRAGYDTRDPAVFEITAQPGPFVVRVVDGARTIDATIRDLPSSVRLTFSPSSSTLTYEGSSRIGRVDVDATDPAGIAGRATELHVDLIDVPSRMDLVYNAGTNEIALIACPGGDPANCVEAPLGALEVSIHDGSPLSVPDGADGIAFEDTAARYGLAARLTKLKQVRIVPEGNATRLRLDKAAGPFAVHVADGQRVIDIGVHDLPSSLNALFDPAGSLSYTSNGGIDELLATMTDPAGIAGRATRAEVTLRGLPSSMTLTWASTGGVVGVDARGRTVGLVEFLLTSGPIESLPADRDGVILRDLTDRYVVFGRLTSLRKALATLDPPDVTIETSANRVLSVDLEQRSGGGIDFTRATLDRLPSSVRIRFVETGNRREILYAASGATNSLTFDTNTGDRGSLHASIGGPLPASLTFCAAPDLACTPAGDRGGRGEADAGSVRLAASEHTTINMLDCVRPLSNCSRANATEFTAVENLRVRVMGFDADSNDPVGYSGHIYLDTDNHELTGHVLNIDGDGGFSASFPGEFRANNRLGKWTWWGLDKDKSGSIVCPGGTSLDVRVFGIWIGVTSYLC